MEIKRQGRRRRLEKSIHTLWRLALAPLVCSGCLASAQFATPEPFATPIEEYIENIAETRQLHRNIFSHAIRDMVVFDNRLYLGYGDPNLNTGPVEIRSVELETGRVTIEQEAPEHSIERFRLLDGALAIPSVDHLDLNLAANIYMRRPNEAWRVVGPLPHALHTLDIAPYNGRLWACGAGFESLQAVKDKNDEALLWEGAPDGTGWRIAFQWADMSPEHISRFNVLIPFERGFYALGARRKGMTMDIQPFALAGDGRDFRWVKLLSDFWAWEAFPLGPFETLVTGVTPTNVSQGLFRAYRIDPKGVAWSLPFLESAEERLVDAVPLEGGGALILARDGGIYDQLTFSIITGEVVSRILMTRDFITAEEWLVVASMDPPTSLAYHNGRLYLGTHEGHILVAERLP